VVSLKERITGRGRLRAVERYRSLILRQKGKEE
jgi:hypothetical protein